MTTTPPTTTLTPRDQTILAGIARGLTRRQTGRLIGKTERSIQSRQRILARRINATSTNQAAIINAAYRAGLMHHITPEPRPPVFLPERQRQILALLGAGLSDADISEHLGIAENTVGTHLNHMFAAIGAKNRAHAVALDQQHRFRDTTHQWQLLLAQFDQRITVPAGRSIHAYDGQRTACKTAPAGVGDRWPIETDVTCRPCAAFLALDHLQPATLAA